MDLGGPDDCRDLGALNEHIGDCHRCPLGDTRTRLVFGVGDSRARLMFVGEAPGKNEDLTGEPFVGAAGKFLDELLASIGLDRTQVYIANVLKCRPPGNRDPQPVEIATCTPFLANQIRLIDPVVIATLGKFATRYALDTTAPISALRGRLYRVGGRRVVPIFHPAAALYDGSKRAVLFDDFRRLATVISRVEAGQDEAQADAGATGAGAGPLGHTGAAPDAAHADAPPSHAIDGTPETAPGSDEAGEQPALF